MVSGTIQNWLVEIMASAQSTSVGACEACAMTEDPALVGIRRFWEQAFNQRDLEALDGMFADGYVNHAALPGTPPGPEGQADLMRRLWTAFPDARFTIEHLARGGATA